MSSGAGPAPGRVLALLGPGLLTAATGVGAGDLATAGFAGSLLGTAVLWAVALGATVKFVLSEGLARWQLATGETIVGGALRRLGRPAQAVFLVYLVGWSFFVGAALMSACGVTTAAMLGLPTDGVTRLALGAGHSLLGVLLVTYGGFRLFERVMAGCVAVLFVSVIATAVLLRPDPAALLAGLAIPRIPQWHDGGLAWTVALLGGVGGTLTVVCYGYWIREQGREGPEHLRTCRVDLAVGYALTGSFGAAMVVIASGMEPVGTGVSLVLGVAASLAGTLGPAGRWIFLVGAWTAVFSSLLGVWQSVPTVFADWWSTVRGEPTDARPLDQWSVPRRFWLYGLATLPLLQVSHPFREVQRIYAILGAAFVPLLAVALLVLNGRSDWVGARWRNGRVSRLALQGTLVLAALAAIVEVASRFGLAGR